VLPLADFRRRNARIDRAVVQPDLAVVVFQADGIAAPVGVGVAAEQHGVVGTRLRTFQFHPEGEAQFGRLVEIERQIDEVRTREARASTLVACDEDHAGRGESRLAIGADIDAIAVERIMPMIGLSADGQRGEQQ